MTIAACCTFSKKVWKRFTVTGKEAKGIMVIKGFSSHITGLCMTVKYCSLSFSELVLSIFALQRNSVMLVNAFCFHHWSLHNLCYCFPHGTTIMCWFSNPYFFWINAGGVIGGDGGCNRRGPAKHTDQTQRWSHNRVLLSGCIIFAVFLDALSILFQ